MMKIELSGLSSIELTDRFRGSVVKNFGNGVTVERVVSLAVLEGSDWRMRAIYSDGVERDLFCSAEVETLAIMKAEASRQ